MGYKTVRESSHIIMSNTIPRHNPINSLTMGAIAKDAGLTPDQFRAKL